MILELKVFNYTKSQTKSLSKDNRWNVKKEFEIPEEIILKLLDELLDIQQSNLDNLGFKHLNINEISRLIKSTKAWKSIHCIIANQKFETSKFTRISLFNNITNVKKINTIIKNKIDTIDSEQPNVITPFLQTLNKF